MDDHIYRDGNNFIKCNARILEKFATIYGVQQNEIDVSTNEKLFAVDLEQCVKNGEVDLT